MEEETAVHSSIHARIIPRTEEPGGLQSMGSQKELNMTEHTEVNTLEDMANRKTLTESCRHPKLVFCDKLEGWGEEGGGKGVQEEGDTCTPMTDSC